MKKFVTTAFTLLLGFSVMSFTGCAGDEGGKTMDPAGASDTDSGTEADGSGNAEAKSDDGSDSK